MQFSYAAIAAALVATATAANSTASAVWVTDVLTAYTTVCPASTQVTFNGVTYTATESQTLTITNCPCTVSKLASVTPVVTVATSKASGYANTTVPAVVPVTATKSAVGTTSAASTKPAASTFTGAANRAMAGSAAGLAGLLGFAAYIL